MSNLVESRGLSKIYSVDYAVKDLDFSIPEGSIFGFMGPNGAGKTTTLRMMTGIIDPTEGTCSVDGLDVVSDKIGVKSLTGYLPEEDFLYGDMKVADHLRYMAELYGVADIGEAVHNALALVEMEDHSGIVIKKLSKGQRRRVAIAKTLVHDPKLVVLDEVTSGLDPIYSVKMMQVIRNLKDKGKTVVFSTHLLDEAMKLCDTLLVIDKGVKVGYGTIEGLLKETGCDNLEDAFFKMIG
ncbi:ABC transporter ATP-binding protein [Candidatus Altiarchaeota archaeon]